MTVVRVRSSIRVVFDVREIVHCFWKEKVLQFRHARRRYVVNVVGRFSFDLNDVVVLEDVVDEFVRKVHFEQKWQISARILVVGKGGQKSK